MFCLVPTGLRERFGPAKIRGSLLAQARDSKEGIGSMKDVW